MARAGLRGYRLGDGRQVKHAWIDDLLAEARAGTLPGASTTAPSSPPTCGAFGGRRGDAITRHDVERWRSSLTSGARTPSKRLTQLAAIFKRAQRVWDLPRNPAGQVDKPRRAARPALAGTSTSPARSSGCGRAAPDDSRARDVLDVHSFAAKQARAEIVVGAGGKALSVVQRLAPRLTERLPLVGGQAVARQCSSRFAPVDGSLHASGAADGSTTGTHGRGALKRSLHTRRSSSTRPASEGCSPAASPRS